MKKQAVPFILLALSAAAGCVYPAERGKMLESRVDQLESDKAAMSASILAQREQLEAQLPIIQEALAKLEAASRRSSADTGVQVEELQGVISMLRGQLEEQTFRIAQLESALKTVNEAQAQQSERMEQMRAAAAAQPAQSAPASAASPAAPSQESAAGKQQNPPAQGGDASSSGKPAGGASQNAAPPQPPPPAPDKPINKSDPKAFAEAISEKLKSDPAAGRKLADEFLRKWPKHAQSARVHYDLGMSHFDEKNYRAALAEFGVFIQPDTPKAFTDSKWAPEALLKSADCFAALKMNQEATMALEEVVNGYPRTPASKVAQARLDEQKKAKQPQKPKGKAASGSKKKK